MSSKLKAGTWIAQGPEMNVLITFTGASPLLEFVVGLDLNSFKKGLIKTLSKESKEVQDILLYPDKYVFETPSFSEAVNNVKGLGDTKFKSSTKDELRDSAILEYYKNALYLKRGNESEATSATIIYAFNEFGLSVGQGTATVAKIKNALKRGGL